MNEAEEQLVEISPEEYEKLVEAARELAAFDQLGNLYEEPLQARVYLPRGITVRARY